MSCSRAAQRPLVVAAGGNGVKHLERVVEIVLVSPSVHYAYSRHGFQFREYEGQQPGTVQQVEAYGGARRAHDFAQLVLDALHGDDFDALRVAAYGVERGRVYRELQLGGEAHGAHHAQGVVAERYVGVERCAYGACAYIFESPVKVYEFAERAGVHAHGHGVDGEVAAGYVFFERAAFHYGVARLAAVAFAPCAHEFQLHASAFYLCRAVCAEYVDMAARAETARHGFCQFDARPYGHEVDVLAFAAYYQVAHESAHGVARAG